MISAETKRRVAGWLVWPLVLFLLALLNGVCVLPFAKKPLSRFRSKIQGLAVVTEEGIKARRIVDSCVCFGDNTSVIKPCDVVAFIRKVPGKPIFDDFFNYYRQLGVNHFIVLGCYAELSELERFKALPDMSLWISRDLQSTWMNKNGIHALNGLLSRYGAGHWCFIIDSDEYFVYPKMDSRSLPELLAYLDQEGKTGFITITIDMFGKQAIGSHDAAQRDDFRWFDSDGIVQWWDGGRKAWLMVGGARRRLLFAERPQSSPLINRVPLVKWRSRYMIARSAGMYRPLRLNNPGFGDRITPTGCLLQYRFCNANREGLLMEMQGRAHCREHGEYAAEVCNKLTFDEVLWHREAAEYRGEWRQFAELGLMNIGTWF